MLKCTFDFVDMGDEIVAVPVGPNSDTISGVFKVNKEGKEIFELLNQGLGRKEIIEYLGSRYENDLIELSKYVDSTIDILQQAGIHIE